MILHRLIIFICLSLLISCTAPPTHIVVSPELFGYDKGVYFDKSISLNVIDQRPSNEVVQVIENDEPATFYSSQDSLINIIKNAIKPALKKQGLIIEDYSNNRIDIYINTALITVNQHMMNYNVDSIIVVTAKFSSGEGTISKSFSTKGKSHGPLSADMAVLERDFNHQLATLLVKITNSHEIQNAIRSSQQAQTSDF